MLDFVFRINTIFVRFRCILLESENYKLRSKFSTKEGAYHAENYICGTHKYLKIHCALCALAEKARSVCM